MGSHLSLLIDATVIQPSRGDGNADTRIRIQSVAHSGCHYVDLARDIVPSQMVPARPDEDEVTVSGSSSIQFSAHPVAIHFERK